MTIAFFRERGRIVVLCEGEGPVSFGTVRRTPAGPIIYWTDERGQRQAQSADPTVLEAFHAWQASEGES